MAENQDVGIQGQDSGEGSFRDRRARLSARPNARNQIYGEKGPTNILNPLWETGGLMWPYTPIISDNATVNYESYDPVHTNQPFMAFRSVAAKDIMCSGLFTAQNQQEAVYCIAAIHFLRTITKMYFGIGGDDEQAKAARGTPPPILLFNAHGTAMFHNVPVVVTSYSIELPQDVDYVEIRAPIEQATLFSQRDRLTEQRLGPDLVQLYKFYSTDGISAWVPSRFNVTVNMTVQNSPNRLRRNFNLNDFRTGRLIKRGGWI